MSVFGGYKLNLLNECYQALHAVWCLIPLHKRYADYERKRQMLRTEMAFTLIDCELIEDPDVATGTPPIDLHEVTLHTGGISAKPTDRRNCWISRPRFKIKTGFPVSGIPINSHFIGLILQTDPICPKDLTSPASYVRSPVCRNIDLTVIQTITFHAPDSSICLYKMNAEFYKSTFNEQSITNK